MKRMLYAVLIVIAGCNPVNKKPSASHDLVTIKIDSIRHINMLGLSEILYVPLETSEECLIGDISKIRFHDNCFYIADFNYSKAVFVFDLNGRLVSRIGSSGRGPGELIAPLDFDLDEKGDVYIYDNKSKKMVLFSVKGEVLNKYDTQLRFMEFSYARQGEVFFRNSIGADKQSIALGLTNLNNGSIDNILESRKVFDDLSFYFSRHYFFRSDSTVFYNQRFTGNVYRLMQDGTVSIAIKIAGGKFPDETFVSRINDDRVFWENPDIIWDIRDIYENTGFTTLLMSKGYYEELRVITSGKSGESIFFKEFDRSVYLGNNCIRGVAKDMFISIIEASEYNKPGWSDKVEKLDIPESEKEKLGRLSEGSNPTLVLFRIAEF